MEVHYSVVVVIVSLTIHHLNINGNVLLSHCEIYLYALRTGLQPWGYKLFLLCNKFTKYRNLFVGKLIFC